MSKTGRRLAAAGVVVGIVVILIVVPPLQVDRLEISRAANRFQAENEARRTLAQIIGGLVIAAGVYYTARRVTALERQVEVAQEGQITERFTRAVEHLGHDSIAIRLGGIYALERIAEDSANDRMTVNAVLTAFVRAHAPFDSTAEQPPPGSTPRLDIQAILDVIGRRPDAKADDVLDLGGAELHGAIIVTDFRGASFDKSNLADTNLLGSELSGASFHETNLATAYAVDANFTSAYFVDANLSGADLTRADFSDANLWDADLSDADLSGADLSTAKNLTRGQIDSAIIDESTKLPYYLTQDEPADDDGEGDDD